MMPAVMATASTTTATSKGNSTSNPGLAGGLYDRNFNMAIMYSKDEVTWDERFNTTEMKWASMLVGSAYPVDRTGHNNIYDHVHDVVPRFWHTGLSFEECCMNRAYRLWKQHDHITLFWSGGIDSTAACIALRETKPKDAKLTLRCSADSIKEFPEFYETVKDICDIRDVNNVMNYGIFADHTTFKITGECGDQIFGSDALKDKSDIWNEHWITIANWDAPYLFQKYSAYGWEDHKVNTLTFLMEHNTYCPFQIKTLFDFYWWINFTLKWTCVNRRMIYWYSKCPESRSTDAFYNSHEFQCWSLTNHDLKHQGTWPSYKKPAKDFIYDHFKDATYRDHKIKVPSLALLLPQTRTITTPESLQLVLEDGRVWYMNDTIPDQILEDELL
jgi:hypothetical protein